MLSIGCTQHIYVNNQKMSKSLNNFLTARDALKAYDGDVIRFLMLSAHYRVQLNFSTELLDSAKASVERLYNAIDNLENLINEVKAEIDILAEYLPKPLSKEEIEKVVEEIIKSTGASSMKDMGMVMKEAKAKIGAAADGRLINEIVKQKLN